MMTNVSQIARSTRWGGTWPILWGSEKTFLEEVSQVKRKEEERFRKQVSRAKAWGPVRTPSAQGPVRGSGWPCMLGQEEGVSGP